MKNTISEHEIKFQVTDFLRSAGVPASLKGYEHLRGAIIMSMRTPGIIYEVTKRLYPEVAKLYNSTASKVERGIRHSIEVAFERGNVDFLNKIFGYTVNPMSGKPTNSEFIATAADYITILLEAEKGEQ